MGGLASDNQLLVHAWLKQQWPLVINMGPCTATVYIALIYSNVFLNHYNYAYNLLILLNGDQDEWSHARVQQQWSGRTLSTDILVAKQ